MAAPPVKPYLTIDDLPLSGKTALLRLDINAPIVAGRIQGKDRIEAASATVDALAAKGSKVVVLAHQGRKGGEDFTSLREHAEILEAYAETKVGFVADVAGPEALAAIRALPRGEALVLENVRGLDDESRKGSAADLARLPFVTALAGVADVYVNDAFSAAHRAQTSLVAFPELLPSAAGLTMDRELTALAQAVDTPEPPAVYFLGGAKPEDSIAVMRANFEKGTLDTALLGGLVANLFMLARGHELGRPNVEVLERKGILKLLPEAQALLDDYDAGIVTPESVAIKDGHGKRVDVWLEDLPTNHPILDLGDESIATYLDVIADAGSLMMNGPAGLYEDPAFAKGTKAVIDAFARSDAFSLMGGGHTVTAIGQFGHGFDAFGYVSLAGGALMSYLTGEELPAVRALKDAAARHRAPSASP